MLDPLLKEHAVFACIAISIYKLRFWQENGDHPIYLFIFAFPRHR